MALTLSTPIRQLDRPKRDVMRRAGEARTTVMP
jgi:hypothetical protein